MGISFQLSVSLMKFKMTSFEEFLNTDVVGTLHNYAFHAAKALAKKQVFGVNNERQFIKNGLIQLLMTTLTLLENHYLRLIELLLCSYIEQLRAKTWKALTYILVLKPTDL